MLEQIRRFVDGEPLKQHECCFHAYRGSLLMVVPDGHIVQKCCRCDAMRTIHIDHAVEGKES